MRLKAKVDSNQALIVAAFRKLGWSVFHTHQLGKGFPDLAISRRFGNQKFTALVEIKDGSKPPSAQKLTPDEAAFSLVWQGELVVINSLEAVELYHKNIFLDEIKKTQE